MGTDEEIGYLSFAFFDRNSNVAGNAGGAASGFCVQYSAAQGALTNIGATNCVEP